MKRTARLLGAAIALGFPQHGFAGTEAIAVSGGQAGGAPAGALFSGFGVPAVNDAGQVVYEGFLSSGAGGVEGANDSGLWRGSTLIAREGSQAGGTPAGAVFGSFDNPVMNDAGQVAFEAFLQTGAGGVTGANDNGVWLGSALVARSGEQAPGTPAGAVFSNFLVDPVVNHAGQVVYFGTLQTGAGGVDASNSVGLWRDSTLIARHGSQAPETPAGAVFSSISSAALNNTGQVVYNAFLETGVGGVNILNHSGIWRDSTLIARAGDQAPGTPAGAVFSGFDTPVINDAGQVVFEGFMLPGFGGVNPTNANGIWRDSTLIAREGSQAGGTPAGALFSSFRVPVINNSGQVVFEAQLLIGVGGVDADNDNGIWRGSALVARTGSQASGTPVGAVFSDFNRPTLSDGGQVAYSASLRMGLGGVDSSNDQGLWIAGTNGETLLIVRKGERLAGRTVETLSFAGFTGGSDGRRSGLNSFSQLAYRATFTNGEQGVFLYTPDIHWTSTASGDWDNTLNWTIGQLPGDPHNVFIDPASNLTVTGPAGNVSLTNLEIGGGTGTVTLSLSSGTLTAHNRVQVMSNGVLGGDGTVQGEVEALSGSVVAPGESAGKLTIDSFVLHAGATLAIELGGTTQSSEYDVLEVLGGAELTGELDVGLIDGFDPEQGDTFAILDFAATAGTFAEVLLPVLDAGLGWHLGELYTDGELHVELEGDLNQDGFVGVEDLDILLANWGDGALAFDYAAGDASGDGLVGAADLAIVQANFGNGTPGGNVPEPGSLALLALGGLTLMRRRRTA